MNLSEIFPNPDSFNMHEVEQEPCLGGWEYSKDQYISTTIGEFGRKVVLFGTATIQTVFSVLQVFSPNWEIFCLLNFLAGLGQMANYQAAFVLGSERLGKSIHVLFGALGFYISFAIGYMALPLVAYFIQSWPVLLFILSLSSLLYIPLWWFIPESSCWLLIKGRVQETAAILRHVVKKNGVTPPAVSFNDLEVVVWKELKSTSFELPSMLNLKTEGKRLLTNWEQKTTELTEREDHEAPCALG
ncbi:solute carrier family 22 member 4-like [Carcharodon carcharias]|uniref:solute carrier family 22 member 4-like n=1 Tax=Carcharodon carcharias TaxID=13397 RepID=UPI001B7E6A8C|nr:solute carrier family 22 member 4-like [Carcharodon carcharias]